jgi:small subunit ribosomal protein S16
MMGRKHRPFFRVCAMDVRRPRGGRVLEELGTYDPMVSDTDARALLKADRIAHWLSVGALPTAKAGVLIKKYGLNGTHLKKQEEARARLAMPKVVAPAPPPPAELTAAKKPAEAPAEGAAPAEAAAPPAEG